MFKKKFNAVFDIEFKRKMKLILSFLCQKSHSG